MANLSGMMQRQTRERAVVDKLYEILPLGEEVSSGASILAKKVGITFVQMAKVATDMEKAGILSRREVWDRSIQQGKIVYWKLNLSREDALSAIVEYQSNELALTESAPSLKARILAYVEQKGSVSSAIDIYNSIKRPKENLDLHNLTHCMYSLRSQGKISFKTDAHGKGQNRKSNDRIPVNITYTAKPDGRRIRPNIEVDNSSPEPISEPEAPEPTVIELPSTSITEFPLVRALVNRRITLEAAAALAEQAGEVEMALALLDKAQVNESELNSEVIALWNAYQECKGA
jgi:hypothetical protein